MAARWPHSVPGADRSSFDCFAPLPQVSEPDEVTSADMAEGGSPEIDRPEISIDIPSSFDLVTVVRMIVASAAAAGGALEGDRLDDLRWVTSEATTNAIEANLSLGEEGEAESGRVHIACSVGHDWVQLRVIDNGPGLGTAPDIPDITHPDRLLIEGGFGIPLMNYLTRGIMGFTSSENGTMLELRVVRE